MSLDLSGQPVAAVPDGRRWLIALGVAVVVAAGVLWLFVGAERNPPDMTATLEHRAALGGRDVQACLSCHARGSVRDRPKGHTGRQDCWTCHFVAER